MAWRIVSVEDGRRFVREWAARQAAQELADDEGQSVWIEREDLLVCVEVAPRNQAPTGRRYEGEGQ